MSLAYPPHYMPRPQSPYTQHQFTSYPGYYDHPSRGFAPQAYHPQYPPHQPAYQSPRLMTHSLLAQMYQNYLDSPHAPHHLWNFDFLNATPQSGSPIAGTPSAHLGNPPMLRGLLSELDIPHQALSFGITGSDETDSLFSPDMRLGRASHAGLVSSLSPHFQSTGRTIFIKHLNPNVSMADIFTHIDVGPINSCNVHEEWPHQVQGLSSSDQPLNTFSISFASLKSRSDFYLRIKHGDAMASLKSALNSPHLRLSPSNSSGNTSREANDHKSSGSNNVRLAVSFTCAYSEDTQSVKQTILDHIGEYCSQQSVAIAWTDSHSPSDKSDEQDKESACKQGTALVVCDSTNAAAKARSLLKATIGKESFKDVFNVTSVDVIKGDVSRALSANVPTQASNQFSEPNEIKSSEESSLDQDNDSDTVLLRSRLRSPGASSVASPMSKNRPGRYYEDDERFSANSSLQAHYAASPAPYAPHYASPSPSPSLGRRAYPQVAAPYPVYQAMPLPYSTPYFPTTAATPVMSPYLPPNYPGVPNAMYMRRPLLRAPSIGDNRSICLSNLHPQTTHEDIANNIRAGGVLESIRILPNKFVCFVTFVDAQIASKFYHDHQTKYDMIVNGHTLDVTWANIHSGPVSREILQAVADGASRNVYIGFKPIRGLAHNDQTRRRLPSGRVMRADFAVFGAMEQINFHQTKDCGFINFLNLSLAINFVEIFSMPAKHAISILTAKLGGNSQRAAELHGTYAQYKISYAKDRCVGLPKFTFRKGTGSIRHTPRNGPPRVSTPAELVYDQNDSSADSLTSSFMRDTINDEAAMVFGMTNIGHDSVVASVENVAELGAPMHLTTLSNQDHVASVLDHRDDSRIELGIHSQDETGDSDDDDDDDISIIISSEESDHHPSSDEIVTSADEDGELEDLRNDTAISDQAHMAFILLPPSPVQKFTFLDEASGAPISAKSASPSEPEIFQSQTPEQLTNDEAMDAITALETEDTHIVEAVDRLQSHEETDSSDFIEKTENGGELEKSKEAKIPEKPRKLESSAKSEKPEKSESFAKSEKPEKSESFAKSEKPEKSESFAKSEKPERLLRREVKDIRKKNGSESPQKKSSKKKSSIPPPQARETMTRQKKRDQNSPRKVIVAESQSKRKLKSNVDFKQTKKQDPKSFNEVLREVTLESLPRVNNVPKLTGW